MKFLTIYIVGVMTPDYYKGVNGHEYRIEDRRSNET
jgi:hypothetical protein